MTDASNPEAATNHPISVGVAATLPHRRRILLGALALLLLAVGTRFIGLGHLDLWGDEVYSYIASTDLLPKLLRWETIENQAHSPLHFIVMKLARAVLGRSEFSTRFPAAVYGTGAVLALYWLIGVRIGWGAAFWSALLLALNPFALEWSREARMYSAWVFYTIVLMALADSALRMARRSERLSAAADWRWWLLGLLFMLMHASNVSAVATIAGIGMWLALMVMIEWPRRGRTAVILALGLLVSAGVYLSSWSLTGLGKMMHYLTAGSGAAGVARTQPSPMQILQDVWGMLAGYTPPAWTFLLCGLAAAGLIVLAGRKRLDFALLLVAIALSPWLTYPVISRKLGYTGRYTFVSLLTLCVGLGVLAAWAWSGRTMARRWLGRAAVLALLTGVCVVWQPVWREIYFVPKLAARQALEPIFAHARPDDALLVVPDWYVSLDPWYQFGKRALVLRPPRQARYNVLEIDHNPALPLDKPYAGDFERIFTTDAATQPGGTLPPATWVFVVDPQLRDCPTDPNHQRRLDLIRPVLQAYGFDNPATWKQLESAAAGKLTLTVRISPTGLGYAVGTEGRKAR